MDAVTPKVLFISYDGMTDQLGQSQVIPYLKGLSGKGYQITILSVEKKAKYHKTGSHIREELNKMGIGWEILFFSARPPLLSKLYDQYRLNKKARELVKKYQFRMLHCRSYVAAAAGLQVKRKLGTPFLFDMRGFWVDERVDSGLWNLHNPLYKFLYKRYKKKEAAYLKEAAHIISLTHNAKAELVNRYHVPAEKITVIPCCADLAHFDHTRITGQETEAIRKTWGISENDKVISYLGSLGGWYMTGEMLDLYKTFREKVPQSKFLFITYDKEEMIRQLAVEKGIPGEDILVKPASRQEVPLFLSVSDWGIFFIRDLYSKKASSPTKQGEIMGMGIPLLCNDIGDTGDIVRQSKSGIVLKAFSSSEYERVVSEMLGSGISGKQHIRESAFSCFDLETGIGKYRDVYKEVIK